MVCFKLRSFGLNFSIFLNYGPMWLLSIKLILMKIRTFFTPHHVLNVTLHIMIYYHFFPVFLIFFLPVKILRGLFFIKFILVLCSVVVALHGPQIVSHFEFLRFIVGLLYKIFLVNSIIFKLTLFGLVGIKFVRIVRHPLQIPDIMGLLLHLIVVYSSLPCLRVGLGLLHYSHVHFELFLAHYYYNLI